MDWRRKARALLIAYNLVAPAAAIGLFVVGRVWEGVLAVLVGHAFWMLSTMWPSCDWFGPVVRRFPGHAGEASVWLTIDDGPDPRDTPVLLDLLDAHGARATFFFIGERAAAHPELVRQVVARGHEVANHTWSHPQYSFWAAGPRRVRTELDRCQRALTELVGRAPRWVRAPAGFKNPWFQHHAERTGMAVAAWSVRGRDGTDRDVDRIVARLRVGLEPGAVVLVHESFALDDGRRLAPLVLAPLLAALDERGLRCVLPGAAYEPASPDGGSSDGVGESV